jgi:hypothetical protein
MIGIDRCRPNLTGVEQAGRILASNSRGDPIVRVPEDRVVFVPDLLFVGAFSGSMLMWSDAEAGCTVG